MSFLFKRGDVWWYYWSESGKKRGKSLKTGDKDEAEVLKGEEDKRRLFNKAGLPSYGGSWANFKKEYLSHRIKSVRDQKTFEKDEFILEDFTQTCEPARVESIDSKFIEKYLVIIAGKTSHGNANSYHRHLKIAFNKAVDWGYIHRSPFQNLSQFGVEKKVPRFLNANEIESFLKAAKEDPYKDAYAMAMVFLYQGARETEIVGLKAEDIDLQNESIKFYGKGHKERLSPLMDDLRKFMLKWLPRRQGLLFLREGRPHSRFSVYLIIKRCLAAAGLNDVTVHDLRSTFVTQSLTSGMELTAVKDIAGHHSIQTTMGYKALVLEHMRKESKKFKFK